MAARRLEMIFTVFIDRASEEEADQVVSDVREALQHTMSMVGSSIAAIDCVASLEMFLARGDEQADKVRKKEVN